MKHSCWIVIIFLVSCCQSRDHRDVVAEQASDRENRPVGARGVKDVKAFLLKFRDITTDTFKIDNSDEFKGVELDNTDFVWLPAGLKKISEHDPFFYACFKFNIDPTHTGLIMRTPSIYASSSIKLLVLNHETNTIFDSFTQLAESVGDAGIVTSTTSWVTMGKLNEMVIRIHETKDKSIEGKNDPPVILTDRAVVMRLKGSKVDTIVMDSKDALKLYNKIENTKKH